MNYIKRLGLVAVCFAAALFLARQSNAQTVSYQPGGGIQLASAEENWKFRMLGYVQSTFNYNGEHKNGAIRNDFFVRRARLDFIFNYADRYQIFFELDGRGGRKELVLAQLDIDYYDGHSLEVGKFITPFSPENYRSSRSLSTVERYNGLNSLFLLPGVDTQYGVMFLRKSRLEYYLSVTNGNGKASDNLKENNDDKDFQGRLVYNISDRFKIGASGHISKEEPQSLGLYDHTFAAFNTANIGGRKFGYLADFEYRPGAWLVRAEGFQYHFDEKMSATQQVTRFFGGYGEIGYFLNGNSSDGLQVVGRVERASFGKIDNSLTGTTALNSFLLGYNWYMDGIFRLQTNFIYEMADKSSPLAGRFEGKKRAFEVLTMLQLKF